MRGFSPATSSRRTPRSRLDRDRGTTRRGNPGPLIERFIAASDELRAAPADLTAEKDSRPWFDPSWVRLHPYRVPVSPGERREAPLVARNFLDVPTMYGIRLVCPPGITIALALATLRVQPGETKTLPLVVSAGRAIPPAVRPSLFQSSPIGDSVREKPAP